MPGLNFLTCTSSGALYKLIISLPIESGMTENSVSLTCLMPHIDEIIQPAPIIDDTVCIYIIDSDLIESITTNTNQASPDKAISNTGALRSGTSLDPKLAGKEVVHGKTTFRYYLNNSKTRNDVEKKINKIDSKSFNWPYYRQYWQTCFAATWLMLMKGHKYPINEKFDSIYKIVSTILYREKDLKFDPIKGLRLIKAMNDIVKYLNLIGLKAVPNLTQEFAGKKVKAYVCDSKVALINLIPIILSNDNPKPLKVDSAHSVLICGYKISSNSLKLDKDGKYNYAEMRFTINDPDPSSTPLKEVSGNDLFDILNPPAATVKAKFLCFTCFCVDKPDTANALTLQTIHLPETGAFFVNPGNISMRDANQIPILSSQWNPDAYNNNGPAASEIEWEKGSGQVSLFDHFRFTNIPIFNTDDSPKTVGLGATIYKTGDKTTIFADAVLKRIINNYFEVQFEIKKADSDSSKNYFNFYSKELAENFKNKLKDLKITVEQEYTLIVELIDADTITTLDKFDVRFKYTPPLDLTITSAPKHDFIGNNIQYWAKCGNVNVTSTAVWRVLNPDANVITNQQGIFEDGLLKTTGEISAVKEYNILASYATSTQEIKFKLLPGIIPRKKAMLPGGSFQFSFAALIQGNLADHLTWMVHYHKDAITQSGFLTAPTRTGLCVVQATLARGTLLSSGETTETDLISISNVFVRDIFIQPEKTIIDIGDTCRLKLKDRPYTTLFDFSEKTLWSADSGHFEKQNNFLYFKPSKPGPAIIKATLKENTYIAAGYYLESDLEITAEVTVVEIKVLDQQPLIARIEPVDAENEPMANYRAECEFKVSVDGATVPIELPDVAASSGKIELLSVTDGNVLPVIHTFKFTPPPPMTTAPYYFNNDETLHVNIKSSAFEQPSTSTEIVVYKPLQKTVATFYPSGKKQQLYQILSYTDSGNILCNGNEYYHGSANGWWDNVLNTYQGGGPYDRNEAIGIHPHYQENGLMHEWYNFETFTRATHTIYEYTYSYGTPITRTYFYTLTRLSVHEGWAHTYTGTYTSSGWTPPPHTLPPAEQQRL